MADHPIIFSAESVQAILAGRKTQTRRVIQKALFPDSSWADAIYPAAESGWIAWQGAWKPGENLAEFTKQQYRVGWPCPYGVPGDRMWVREAWAVYGQFRDGPGYCYRADDDLAGVQWRPSIYMPRCVSRITLEIINVRVERVQEISETDAAAELGAPATWPGPGPEPYRRDLRGAYRLLWDELNAKRGYPWTANPWVWVIEFARQPI